MSFLHKCKRQATLGSYSPNAFIIRLGTATPLIDRVTNKIDNSEPEHLAVLFHEYWHYLHNISTVTGLYLFCLYHQLIRIFTKTLTTHGNGRSVGSGSLSDAERHEIQTLGRLLELHEGDSEPLGLSCATEFEVTDVVEDEVELNLDSRELSVKTVILKLNVTLSRGASQPKEMQFGARCIEECIAYEIDRMVASGLSSTGSAPENSPLFPYRVIQKLGQHLFKADLSRIELIAIGTLSLLTTRPGSAFVILMKDYSLLRKSGKDSREALDSVWEKYRTHTTEAIETLVQRDLPLIKESNKDRGLAEHAHDFLLDLFIGLLRRRLKNPFFDIQVFTDNALDLSKLFVMVNEITPCDALQEVAGPHDQLERDFMVSFGSTPAKYAALGPELCDFLRTLECQVEYFLAHFALDEFKDSGSVNDAICPFYTSCNLPDRLFNPDSCKNRPWELAASSAKFACWYVAAVHALVGTVRVIGRIQGSTGEIEAIKRATNSRAHTIWIERGRPHGEDWAHWFQAKRDLGIPEDRHF